MHFIPKNIFIHYFHFFILFFLICSKSFNLCIFFYTRPILVANLNFEIIKQIVKNIAESVLHLYFLSNKDLWAVGLLLDFIFISNSIVLFYILF